MPRRLNFSGRLKIYSQNKLQAPVDFAHI